VHDPGLVPRSLRHGIAPRRTRVATFRREVIDPSGPQLEHHDVVEGERPSMFG
jgi:hypothetical protein